MDSSTSLKLYNTEPLIVPGSFKGIILIGTIHLDLDARASLFSLLEILKVNCIAVEISRFSISFRKKNYKQWNKKLDYIRAQLPYEKRHHFRLELLKRQIAMPFEWHVSCQVARKKKVPAVALDKGSFSRQELPLWEKELLTLKNIEALVNEPDLKLSNYFKMHYLRAKSIFTKTSPCYLADTPLSSDPEWIKREQLLAKRLEILFNQYGSVVYIGGWLHITQNRGLVTLARLLKHHIIARFLLTGDKIVQEKPKRSTIHA